MTGRRIIQDLFAARALPGIGRHLANDYTPWVRKNSGSAQFTPTAAAKNILASGQAERPRSAC